MDIQNESLTAFTTSGDFPCKERENESTSSSRNTEIHDNDVIVCDNAQEQQHPGNMHWRRLIREGRHEARSLPRNQRPTIMSESIVLAIRSQSPPGRFLALDEETHTYHDIGNEQAFEMTANAMKKKSRFATVKDEAKLVAVGVADALVTVSSLAFMAI